MTIPYFSPTTIDGETRRALVERVEACAAFKYSAVQIVGHECWPVYSHVVTLRTATDDEPPLVVLPPALMLRLTRLAVIEWVQNLRRDSACEREDFVEVLLRGGDRGYPPMSDAGYNELAHRLADALDFKH